MHETRSGFWTLAFGVSVTLLMCGSIALYNAGIVADENGLTDNVQPALWIMFAAGLLGVLVSLPAMLAARRQTEDRHP